MSIDYNAYKNRLALYAIFTLLRLQGLQSETDPYIYQFNDEEDVMHYWIIGKKGPELEHYGFAEYLHPSESEWTAGYVARTNNNEAPWLFRAWEELGFDFDAES